MITDAEALLIVANQCRQHLKKGGSVDDFSKKLGCLPYQIAFARHFLNIIGKKPVIFVKAVMEEWSMEKIHQELKAMQ